MFERKDHFYRQAKREGYPSRSAYKLLEILQKFKIATPGDWVLDLGASPGGWIKVLAYKVGPRGKVVGIDRAPLKITPPPNAVFLEGDVSEGKIAHQLAAILQERKFDLITSDLSPDLSGISFRDSYQSYELGRRALALANSCLKLEGHLLLKIFPGEELKNLKTSLKEAFEKVHTLVPEATRKTSSEVYLICTKRLG